MIDAIESLGRFAVLEKAAKGIEVAGHKYLMRTPDGKGSWRYSYKPPADHKKQAGAFDPNVLKQAIEQAAIEGRSHPFLMPHNGKVYLATASGRYNAKEIAISGYELQGDGATSDNVDFDMARSLANYPTYVRTRRLAGGYSEARIEDKATSIAVVPPPSARKKKNLEPVWHEGQWKHVQPHQVATYERETSEFKYEKSLTADSIDALEPLTKSVFAMSGHEYLSRAPDSKGGWKYTYAGVMAHLKRAVGAHKAKRVAKVKAARFWDKQTAASLRANPSKLRTAKLAYKSEDPIDALLPLTKSCADCAPATPCSSCADTQKSGKPKISHAQAMQAAQRLGVEWEHAEWTATDLQAGMQVELEHTRDLEKAADIALDHLCERPDYYKKLRSVEAGAKGSRTTFCVRQRAMKKAGPARITHEGMQGERPGHKYIIRIPDGKGGWKYSYREPQRKRSFKKEQPDPEVQAQLGQAKKTAVAMQALIDEGKLKGTAAYHVTLTSGLLRKHEAGMEDFKAALAKAAPENAKVKARTKELHSALGKIVSKTREGKARYQTAHGLQDMTGARIVCKSVQDVKATVENLKKSFTVIEGDDYVDRPKDVDKGLGYRSHHLILKDKDGLEKEVQIRTPFQDKHGDWCHDVYKPVNEDQERVMAEKGEEIEKYARDISDYFYQAESGKMGAEKVNCPDSVKSTFGCL